MRNFAPLPLSNSWTNLDAASNTSPQGVDVQNLIKIDSAVAAVRMRMLCACVKKRGFAWGFFCLHIDPSIRLSVLRHAYRPHF